MRFENIYKSRKSNLMARTCGRNTFDVKDYKCTRFNARPMTCCSTRDGFSTEVCVVLCPFVSLYRSSNPQYEGFTSSYSLLTICWKAYGVECVDKNVVL